MWRHLGQLCWYRQLGIAIFARHCVSDQECCIDVSAARGCSELGSLEGLGLGLPGVWPRCVGARIVRGTELWADIDDGD